MRIPDRVWSQVVLGLGLGLLMPIAELLGRAQCSTWST